ncbi:DNA-binding protein [Oscillospiraceae bacterium OttesenSCG-928-F05]|nr:DNA-binding protein [Oscillospiraceae bacterium OttesenSCG-928-F05]
MICLGLDTSNYTTSAALYDADNGLWQSSRALLTVKAGELGLRQSEALFQHVAGLPDRVSALGKCSHLVAVGASTRPRQAEGSYMPCFLAGESFGRGAASLLGVPFFAFSHQQGHVAAAALSAGREDLLCEPLLALHISGGTTEMLHVTPDEGEVILCKAVGGTNDLSAGQVIDRCGKLLGLPFPSGQALDALSLKSDKSDYFTPRGDGDSASLSGLENKMKTLFEKGAPPEEIARFALLSVGETLSGLTARITGRYPGLPLLCSGGVMANTLLRKMFAERFCAIFASPELASDNAVGTAYLAAKKYTRAII